MNFKITERNILRTCKNCIVGDNSDYIAKFEFDDEWTGKIKTARFCHGGSYLDVILDDDNTCLIPSEKSGWLQVGVYTADMTTTSCSVYVVASVKDLGTPQPAPAEDIYQQLLERIEQGASTEAIVAAVQDYMEHHPVNLEGYATEDYVKRYVDDAVQAIDLSAYVKTDDLNTSISEYVTEHHDDLKGDPGDPGDPGQTPVRGTDYWNAEDIASIKGYVDDAILGGEW